MVKALAGKRADAAAESCTAVTTLAVTLTTLVIEFPGSPDVLVYSATIIASSSLVCSDDEKLSLAEVDAMFDEAVATLESAVEAAQSQLETLTGSTASPEEIAEVVTTAAGSGETTAAASGETTAAPGTTAASGDTAAPGTTAASGNTAAPGEGLYVYFSSISHNHNATPHPQHSMRNELCFIYRGRWRLFYQVTAGIHIVILFQFHP